jgi:hypothetical protein
MKLYCDGNAQTGGCCVLNGRGEVIKDEVSTPFADSPTSPIYSALKYAMDAVNEGDTVYTDSPIAFHQILQTYAVTDLRIVKALGDVISSMKRKSIKLRLIRKGKNIARKYLETSDKGLNS